jgi:xanthosine utilization system XapX-like protein
VLEAMFPSKGKILAIAVSWFTQFILIYNFIRLRVHSPPITAVSGKLPIHYGESLSCVELPVMSLILVPHD